MARTFLTGTMLIVALALGATPATHAQQATQAQQVTYGPPLEAVTPQVAAMFDTFPDAGGMEEVLIGLGRGDIGHAELTQLWQTGMIWGEVYREEPANLVHREGDYPDANTLINYAQANYANANYVNADDEADKPLSPVQLKIMIQLLEELAKKENYPPPNSKS